MDLTTLRSRVRSWLNISDTARISNTIIDGLVNESQNEIMEIGELLFGDATATFSITTGTNQYVPTISGRVIVSPIKMWFVDATGAERRIEQVSYSEFVDRYPDSSVTDDVADGADFAVYGTDANGNPVFYIGPTPNADQTGVQLACRTRFSDLVNDTDDNALTETGQGAAAIVYKTCAKATVFVDQEERQGVFENLYRSAYNRLLITHGRARNAGKRRAGMREPG